MRVQGLDGHAGSGYISWPDLLFQALGAAMPAIYAIALFIIVFAVLNFIQTGRID